MKSFNELTKVGKYRRCKKALEILQLNVNCGHILDKATTDLWEYEDSKSECDIDNCRKQLLNVNKYRGYTNYCPMYEVSDLLD